MNEELQNFLIKFTTEGFADLKNSLNETNRQLDEVSKSFDKSKKTGDSFFSGLMKWTTLVGGLTAAFVVLRNTIRGVFDTAYDVVDLYQQEQLLGVEARVLEKYGLVAQRNRGSQSDAYSFFGDVNELMGRFRSGKINADDAYKFSKIGLSFNYDANKTLSQNRDDYLTALHRAVSSIDLNNADQISIMKDLIRPKSMQTLFMANDEQFAKQMAWGDKWRVLSKDESDLQDAQNLITVQMEWKQVLTDFKLQLMPILSKVLTALEPLIPVLDNYVKKLGSWVDEHADEIAKWVEQGVDWLIHEFPKTLSDLYECMKAIVGALEPIVEFVIGKIGGSFKSAWDTAKLMWSGITGDEEYERKKLEFADKYFKEGSTAGGYWGDYMRWLARGTENALNARTTVNNNNPTYVVKAGTYFPKDTVLNNEHPTGAMMAHYASSAK